MITSFAPDPIGICVLGSGAAVLGLAALVWGPALRRPNGRLAFGLALVALAAVATAAPLLGQLGRLWLPPLLLAGFGAAWLLSSWSPARRLLAAAATLAARPGLQGAALLVAGPLLVAGWAWDAEGGLASGSETGAARYGPAVAGQPEVLALWTDQGGTVPATRLPAAGRPVSEAAEAQLMHSEDLELRLLRTGEPSWGSNCHGWVFTAGRYQLDGEAVELILQDNGYRRVAAPRPGDLVVYRASGGGVAHTGVVRVARADLLLVESKWAELGVYLHRPQDYHPRLGLACEYYRSPRPGHLLRGLEDSGTAETAAPGS